eukprot:PhM_4_TR12509/c0_g1_i1/m.65037
MSSSLLRRPHKVIVPNGSKFSELPQYLPRKEAREFAQRTAYKHYLHKVQRTTGDYIKSFHNRQQRRESHLIQKHNGNVFDALEEFLRPTQSMNSYLKTMRVDRSILEEIYREQHGRRHEYELRKGQHWERWIAQGSNNWAVLKASERAQLVFGMGTEVKMLAAARHVRDFPPLHTRQQRRKVGLEVPIIGRVNVGKSSFLNAVLNAFVAEYDTAPGTTLTANFYNLPNAVTFVDLPGYGFVSPLRAPKEKADDAQALTWHYLNEAANGKRNVRRVFILLDADFGIRGADKGWLDKLEMLGLDFSVILCRTDEVPILRLARKVDYVRTQLVHYTHCKELMMVSSLRLSGITQIQNLVANFGYRAPEEPGEKKDGKKEKEKNKFLGELPRGRLCDGGDVKHGAAVQYFYEGDGKSGVRVQEDGTVDFRRIM